MTEQQVQALGYILTKQYIHDEYHTHRYTKGVLEVEFTYEGDKLITQDLTINEVIGMPVTEETLNVLTPILGSITN